jgi:hypothetical protein
MTLNKVECFLLSTNAADVGAGSQEVRVKFRPVENKKPGETRP